MRTFSEKRLLQKPGKNKKNKRPAAEDLSMEPRVARLVAYFRAGQMDAAEKYALFLTEKFSQHPVPWKVLGFLFHQSSRYLEAAKAYKRYLRLSPLDAEIHNNLGVVLQTLGQTADSIVSFNSAISVNASFAQALFNLGNSYQALGKVRDAEESFRRSMALDPHYVDAYVNLGLLIKELGRLDDAENVFRGAISIAPNRIDLRYNLGLTLAERGEREEAKNCFQEVARLDPENAESNSALGALILDEGRLDEAEKYFRKAINCDPAYAPAFNNLAIVLKGRLNLTAAKEFAIRATELDPEYADAHNTLGIILLESDDFSEAEAALRQAIAINPGYAAAEAQLVYLRKINCDFSVDSELENASARLGITTDPVAPFACLSWFDNAEHQLLRSKAWCAHKYTKLPRIGLERRETWPQRLKVGYFSADFHNFAGMNLMVGLLEEHDRENFEIFAFSYGPDKDDAMRRRIRVAVDHFIDIKHMPDIEVVDLVRSAKIDIAIHRNGYTRLSRTELFQHRMAPVQINYLGYPGSLGADFIDYIVGDSVVIPDSQRRFYSEKVIYMPHTYQPNDDKRQISSELTTRAEHGLPEKAFVIGCFNNSYKIGRKEFEIWMRTLKNYSQCVLWLLKPNIVAEKNLRRYASDCGVDPNRIIFAEKIPHASHLARHTHMDLAVDTFNYNAHTTASDALWVGIPLVTKAGRQFSARVSASLLAAVGLSELITETEEEYEAMIRSFVINPGELKKIRGQLAASINQEPLFDTRRYARNFENGLRQAYSLAFQNAIPSDIWVSEELS